MCAVTKLIDLFPKRFIKTRFDFKMKWKNGMLASPIWDSNLPNNLKIQCFRVAIEVILIYGSECLTLTKAFGKQVKRNIHQNAEKGEECLLETTSYQHLIWRYTTTTETIKHRSLNFVGHCWRRRDEVVH